MGSVTIVVNVPDGHLPSIYALILSIIKNKYEESIYQIYLSIRENETSQLEALLALQTNKVSIIPVSDKMELSGNENAIRLQWNMLVTGDLTEIYDLDPVECENDAGCDTPFRSGPNILQCEPEYSPEEYFDHPLSGQWLRYYKMSPLKNVPLRRCSFVETQGEISIKDSDTAVPIAISVCDWNVPSTVALLYSIRRNTSTYTQLDIRVFYRNLSKKHADILLSFCDDNTSIILYNVKRCTDAEFPNTRIIPPLLAFDEYTKVIYINPECLCLDDIRVLYQCMIKPYDVMAVGTIPDNDEMPGMMLLNLDSWIQSNLYSNYTAMTHLYRSFQELMYMASGRQIDCIKSFSICSFKDEDDPWMSSDEEMNRLVWGYLSMSPQFEQLKTEALSYERQREVAEMQELLKQVKDLEIENEHLLQQVQSLEQDNTSLRSERDQFLYELLETRKSFTYRIGRVITFLPRKLRGERKMPE